MEIFSIIYTKLKPRLYLTSSAIKVNNIDLSLLGNNSYLTKRENISTHAQDATGYTMLLNLAKKMSLIPDTVSQNILSMDKKYTEIINSLQSKIQYTISPVTNTIVFNVTSKNPKESQEIANLIAVTYKDYAFNKKKRFFKKRKLFIKRQYDLYKKEIADMEEKIVDIKKNKIGLKINKEIEYTLNEYSKIQNKLEDIEIKISEIVFQRSQLTDKYYRHPLKNKKSEDNYITDKIIIPDNIRPTSDIFFNDIGFVKLSDRLTSIQNELNNNLAYYTPLHPKIIALKTAMKNTIVEIVEKLNEILYIEAIYQRDQLKSIIVTSSIHLEGRSITISNLAITYAQLGMRVLLMECDLRNPSIEKIFGINDNPGLTDILLGKCRWNNCLITVSDLLVGGFSVDDILSHPGLENLYLVSHGSYQINPSVILESKQMHSLMVELKNNFDIILIDTPPFLTSADAMILCRHVDGVIIVYRLGKTPKNQLHQCIERLESINMKILGLVMNDMAVDHLNKKIKKGGKKTSGSDYTIPG